MNDDKLEALFTVNY